MLFRYAILVFMLCYNSSIIAQYTFSGKIIDKKSNSSIANAEVYNLTTGAFVLSDETGQFEFKNLENGYHEIAIFSYEYATLTEKVLVEKNIEKQFELEVLGVELSEVVVNARKEELFALKRLRPVEGTSIYAGKKSEVVLLDLTTGNLANNNSRQIYAQIVGLNIYEGNDGGLQLGIGGRGLDPNRTANFNTRQNGYDISADVLGYPESYYTPPAEALSEIQVVRGAASLQYGTQFGGLINFKFYEPPYGEKVELISRQSIGSFGLFNTFNAVGGHIGKWRYFTYYNYKKGDGYREYSAFDAHNFFVSATYQFSKKTALSVEGTYFKYLAQQAGGLTDVQFNNNPRQSTRTRNWFEVDWKLYNLKLNHQFNENSKLSLSLFALDAQRNALGFRGNPTNLNENPITALDEQLSDETYLMPRDLIKSTFKNWGVETKFLTKYKLKEKKAVLLLGAKYYNANNTSLQGAGSRGVEADFTFYNESYPDYANQSNFEFPNLNIALFGEHIFYLNDRLSITPGIRYEYIKTESEGVYQQVNYDNAGNPIDQEMFTDNRNLKRNFVLFGIGASYQPSTSIELYGNISQNYRSVTFSDIRVVNPTFIIDEDISDEKGFTTDIGIRGRWKKNISYDIGVFNILYNDRIGIIINERANRERKNIGKAVIFGLESFIDFNIARILNSKQQQFKFKWFINNALTHSRYIESEENNVEGKQVEFIPTINLKTGIQVGYKDVLLATQFTYLTKQYTDVQNSATPAAGDARSGVIGEIPAYHVLDLSLSYKWKMLRLETGINNIFDTAYFTRRATGYPGPGIIPSDGRGYYLTLGIKL